MPAIVAYGSLINQEQLCARSYSLARAHPVVVNGYRRVFNQEPSWRKGAHEHRAVLNLMHSDQDCFNGLLVALRDDSDFLALDERERGYSRTLVAPSQLVCSADILRSVYSEFSNGQTYVYLGKPEKRNDDILPNKDYLNLCLCGAKYWGEAFYEQFLQTTYVGESTLKQLLRNDIL